MNGNRTDAPTRLSLRHLSVSSITFMDNDLIVVIYKDGRVDTWDVNAGSRNRAGTWLNQPWTPWKFGSRLVVTSFKTRDIGEIVFFESGAFNFKLQRLLFDDASTIAVSDSGRIVVGTLSGKVYEVEVKADSIGKGKTTQSDQLLGHFPLDKDAVQSLAFWDENTVLAASASSGIYASIGDSSMEKISKLPAGRRLLVGNGFLAYATSSDLEVAHLRVTAKILGDREFWFSSIIALLGLCGTFWPILKN